MNAVDPKDLRPGDWFVWHELKPPRYRVVEPLDAAGTIRAEDERNIALHGPGSFPSARVSVADRRFERPPTPERFRRPLPDTEGTMILAQVIEGGKLRTTLAVLEDHGSYGLKWADGRAGGEWLNPADITDWRLIDGLDTVRPDQED